MSEPRRVFLVERGEGGLSQPVVLLADQVAGFTLQDDSAWGNYYGVPRTADEPEIWHWQADVQVLALLTGGGEVAVGLLDASGPVGEMGGDKDAVAIIHARAIQRAEEWMADLTARLAGTTKDA